MNLDNYFQKMSMKSKKTMESRSQVGDASAKLTGAASTMNSDSEPSNAPSREDPRKD